MLSAEAFGEAKCPSHQYYYVLSTTQRKIYSYYDGYRGHRLNLNALDLNLLVALRALLHERNVTRAGEAVGLTQPTMSASLARLRRHFHDELLVRTGNRYELTPMGTALIDQVDAAYAVVGRVFSVQKDFDPATSEREFTLVTSDYALAVYGRALSAVLRDEAPHVRLRLQQISVTAVEDLDTTLRGVDGLLTPRGVLTGYRAVELFQDRWLCLVSAENSVVDGELSTEDLARMPWVAMYDRPSALSPANRQMNVLGIEPRIEVLVETFLAIPAFVAGTDRVALIQQRLAEKVRNLADVRTVACPLDLDVVTEAMWYHPAHTHDAGHAWFRGVVTRAVDRM